MTEEAMSKAFDAIQEEAEERDERDEDQHLCKCREGTKRRQTVVFTPALTI